jgi:hypothetical protein
VRDEKEPTTLRVPNGETIVQLTLELEESQPGPYRAILQTLDGMQVWSQQRINTVTSASPESVVLRVPATALRSGDYRLTLFRQDASGVWVPSGDYAFRVRIK